MMPFILFRHALIAIGVVTVCGCSAPEQQEGPGTPSHTPQIAQGPAPADGPERAEEFQLKESKVEESRIAEPARDALPSEALGRARRAIGMNQTAPTRAVAPATSEREADLREDEARYRQPQPDTERYAHLEEHGINLVSEQPVSTFSVDVDTGAYANVRRFLNAGQLPPRDAVRIEELVNYFSYDYAAPKAVDQPFAVHAEVAPSPWNPDTHLLRIALKGQDVAKAALPPANLVFLIDVSGSMNESTKLPLLKTAFKGLARQLRPQDKVSLVVYAGASGVVLEPTAGSEQDRILAALERLSAGGSTHGAAGIDLAYQVAQSAFIPGGINRVLLATDGDFNVGITRFETLKNMIERKRATGISLSTLGFGTGNFNDHLMEQLADAGNGNYSYIDTLNEGRKVLIDEFTSTLATIATDVKVQIEFNPARVAEYRLIGYENRALRREDFNNDRVDAGEIGAGHAVTALYEIRLAGKAGSLLEPLRYRVPVRSEGHGEELALLRLRYKAPAGGSSRLIEVPLGTRDIQDELAQSSDDFRFAAAVSAFGQALRGGRYLGGTTPPPCQAQVPSPCVQTAFGYQEIATLAKGAMTTDPFGYRAEFLQLIETAQALSRASGTTAVVAHER